MNIYFSFCLYEPLLCGKPFFFKRIPLNEKGKYNDVHKEEEKKGKKIHWGHQFLFNYLSYLSYFFFSFFLYLSIYLFYLFSEGWGVLWIWRCNLDERKRQRGKAYASCLPVYLSVSRSVTRVDICACLLDFVGSFSFFLSFVYSFCRCYDENYHVCIRMKMYTGFETEILYKRKVKDNWGTKTDKNVQ